MPKKINNIEIEDAALSRRLWRKAISIDDENAQIKLHKETFSAYQIQLAQDSAQPDTFPACVKNIALRNALLSLTAKQRRAIELYYFKNATQTDIAEALGCSQVSVSKLLCRAIENIKRSF